MGFYSEGVSSGIPSVMPTWKQPPTPRPKGGQRDAEYNNKRTEITAQTAWIQRELHESLPFRLLTLFCCCCIMRCFARLWGCGFHCGSTLEVKDAGARGAHNRVSPALRIQFAQDGVDMVLDCVFADFERACD